MTEKVKIVITARAIIFNEQGQLLLVKNNKKGPWFTPGGWLQGFESLEEACIREVMEELGIIVDPIKFIRVDYFRLTARQNIKWQEAINKIEHYFLCKIREGSIQTDENNNNLWHDTDEGHTKFVKFFNKSELEKENIVPEWLMHM